MYLGAVLVTLAGWLTMTQSAAELTKLTALPPAAWGLVLFLGFIPSGLAFFLFNHGALKVDPASLAIVNNLKIPLAVVLTLLVFGDLAGIQDPLRFGMGSLLMLGALLWNEARARSPAL
jgi:drug/metabolite transporter (DMT)-like permease